MMFRSAELRVHRDTMHAGEKKYKCKDCGKLFSQKGSLNRHMAQVNHLTRKMYYSCVMCSYLILILQRCVAVGIRIRVGVSKNSNNTLYFMSASYSRCLTVSLSTDARDVVRYLSTKSTSWRTSSSVSTVLNLQSTRSSATLTLVDLCVIRCLCYLPYIAFVIYQMTE